MLEGTDLSSAYSPMLAPSPQQQFMESNADTAYAALYNDAQKQIEAPPKQHRKSIKLQRNDLPDTAFTQQLAEHNIVEQAPVKQQQQFPRQAPQQYASPPQQMAPQFDASMFNRQFENEQKMALLLNELKKQKTMMPQQAPAGAPAYAYEESYYDKLMTKRKDVFKFVQSGLIILFAISIHFFIDFILKHYLQEHELSFQREVLLRLLYPAAIIFIAWNFFTLSK